VRETSGSNTYHISSDNLLVQRALLECGYDPTYASSSAGINQAIGYCCGNSADLMHEIVLGSNVEIPVPIHTANNYLIANSTSGRLFHGVTPSVAGGNHAVYSEYHNATSVFPDCIYADTATYTFMELHREGNNTGAQQESACLNLVFDGRAWSTNPTKTAPAPSTEYTRRSRRRSTSTPFFIAILVIVATASFIMRSTSDSVIPGSTSATVGIMGCEQ